MRALALALALGACGGATARPVAPAPRGPAAEPTFGICARDRTPGATTARELLAASADARRRGCLREAALDALAARDAAGGGPLAMLFVQEIGQDVRSSPLVGPGETSHAGSDLPDEAWAKPVFDLATLEQTVDAIAEGVASGAIPASERESGRITRLLLRYTAAVPCLQGGTRRSPKEIRESTAQSYAQLLVQYQRAALTTDKLANAKTRALGSKWLCDPAGAAAEYAAVATLERDPSAALDARLSAWEAEHIPGGYAGHLAMHPGPNDEVLKRTARDFEAARTGDGAVFRAGTTALAALDKLAAGSLSADQTALVAWYRAVVTLRMLARSAEAKRLADRAIELAVRAKRADIVDGARLVGAFAATELGDAAETERLVADLFASTKLRGALGVREFLVLRFQVFVKELGARGRSTEQLLIARAVRRSAKDLTFISALALHDLYGDTLAKAGRLDEALEERTALLAELEKHPDRAGGRDALLATLRLDHARLRTKLEGTSALSSVLGLASDEDRPIFAGLAAGDLRPMSALIRTPSSWRYLSFIPFVCAARSRELIQASTAALDMFRDAKAAPQDGTQETMAEYVSLLLPMQNVSRAMMECGATIHDRAVFEAGHAIARELDFREPHEEALAAEAAGKPDVAAATWARLSREALSDAGGGNVRRSSSAGSLLERAARAYLGVTPPRVEEAVAILEQTRSRDLRVSRSLQRPARTDPALAPLLDVERKLAAAQQRAGALIELGDSPELAKARSGVAAEVASLSASRDAAVRALAKADPGAYRAAALAPPLPLRDIQARLQDDEYLVYYLVEIVEAWAIVVDKRRATAVRLRARDGEQLPSLIANVLAYRRNVRAVTAERGLVRVKHKAEPSGDLRGLRASLYDGLVKPLEPHIPAGARVLVIPDEETADLAFAELGPPDHPWIERNAIRMLPGTYLLDPVRREALAGARAIVIGDPDYSGVATGGEETWPPLPATRKEATDVARRLGATPLLGAAADEAAVKKALPTAGIIHFATHGQAFASKPATSRIVFAAKPGEDGYLHAYEIEQLRLRAKLVVLSACETGAGQAVGSEGTLALDRAFLAAGAGAVVSSLWVVPDAATAALMMKFYEELGAGRPADVALRNAMLWVRRQPAWSDPFNWAAFRVVGAGMR